VRSPFGGWPAGLYAKSLRRSGEVAWTNESTPSRFLVFLAAVPGIVARAGRAVAALCRDFRWADQDSNLDLTDYESAALTD
jgi:hypothetical protein